MSSATNSRKIFVRRSGATYKNRAAAKDAALRDIQIKLHVRDKSLQDFCLPNPTWDSFAAKRQDILNRMTECDPEASRVIAEANKGKLYDQQHSDTAPQDTERTPTAPQTSMAMCTVPPHSRCIPPPPCCPGTDHTHTDDSRQPTSDPSDSSTDPQHTRCSPKPRRCPSQADTCPPHSRCSPRPRHYR